MEVSKMGKAVYCDRCGDLFNTSEIEVKKVRINGAFNEELVVDLCIECARNIEGYVYGDDLKKKKQKKGINNGNTTNQ